MGWTAVRRPEVQGEGLEEEGPHHDGEADQPDGPAKRVGHEAQRMVVSGGAVSTPIRWRIVVVALANAANTART